MSRIESVAQPSILVVDDVPKNIQLVANFLTKAGYQINFAVDGIAAIEHAKKTNFNLILLDIMMPGIDGFEVCRQLKSNPSTAHVPIIFLTAKTDEDSIARGFDIGGVDFITKPFNQVELLARVKTHLNLQQRELELKELNYTKDTILSIIGHDLKTPMANIISLGDLIVNSSDLTEVERNELINDLAESGRQGVWLLDNLLSWTRVEAGTLTNKPKKLDLEDIVNLNIEFIFKNAQHKKIHLEANVESGIKIYADLNIVHTIMRNLLSNSVKFTHENGTVGVNAYRTEGGEVCLEVSDTGIGIKESKIPGLFTSLSTFTTPGTKQEKGSGLGLVLVKNLIDLINARIEVESKEGEGTKFILYFKEYNA